MKRNPAASIVAMLIVVWTMDCSAQSMYKCGNSYSQQPCSADAKPVQIQGVVPPKTIAKAPLDEPVSPQTLALAQKACGARILSQLKDPDSAKFDPPLRGALRFTAGGAWVRDYDVLVNAKNSYGGYTGSKRWACSFELTEQKVIWAGPAE